jgi:chemosensory pili system protein ChpB (putative protein-glutamate methylesterase)
VIPPIPAEAPAAAHVPDPAPAAVPPPVALGDHSRWALVEDDAIAAAPLAAPAAATPAPLASFDSDRLSLVELEPDVDPGSACPGAVLVLAGIGGPDALRRLLSALPAGLSTAVLVYMRLDGGRDGNLVKQMARVSALPVVLAEDGLPVEAGQVYILPDDVGVTVHNRGLHFIGDTRGIQIDALPPEHSGVVLLSGAEAAQVEAVLALSAAGAWVAGQTGEGCYDPIAASAVIAAGQEAGEPQQLAATIAERWGTDA